jgi:uncharacterized membrane protein
MRLQRLGIQKNLQDRFQKLTFWQKYGTTIITLIFMLVTAILFIVMFQKMAGGWQAVADASETIKEMASAVNNLATRMGGGVVPAN